MNWIEKYKLIKKDDVNVLLIIDYSDLKNIRLNINSNNWKIYIYKCDFNNLYKDILSISNIINKYKIDFLVFSQNDNVSKKYPIGKIIKKLRTGYTSLSPIDNNNYLSQITTNYKDFIEGNVHKNYNDLIINEKNKLINDKNEKYFSIIIDSEQIGGANYGLIRILNILKKYNVYATICVTNIINSTYPNLFRSVKESGHEIAAHGLFHEYLSKYDVLTQENLIRIMIGDFKKNGIFIEGANFIERYDKNTLKACLNVDLKYLIINESIYFKMINIMNKKVRIYLYRDNDKNNKSLYLIPVNLDTYDKPWRIIKNEIDIIFNYNNHIFILVHDFKEGSLNRIYLFERMLDYLVNIKKIKGMPVNNHLDYIKKYYILNNDNINKFNIHYLPDNLYETIRLIDENIFYLNRRLKLYKKIYF